LLFKHSYNEDHYSVCENETLAHKSRALRGTGTASPDAKSSGKLCALRSCFHPQIGGHLCPGHPTLRIQHRLIEVESVQVKCHCVPNTVNQIPTTGQAAKRKWRELFALVPKIISFFQPIDRNNRGALRCCRSLLLVRTCSRSSVTRSPWSHAARRLPSYRAWQSKGKDPGNSQLVEHQDVVLSGTLT